MEEPAYALRPAERAEDAIKVPPHSVEAEQSLLGGLMLDSDRWDAIVDIVAAEDFYRKEHRLVFGAVASLVGDGQPADAVTVSEWLEKHGELAAAGGAPYLHGLVRDTPGAANLPAYARIVRERGIVRRLIGASQRIADAAYRPEGRGPAELLDYAEKTIFDLAREGPGRAEGFRPIREMLGGVLDHIDVMAQSDNPLTGVSTGYSDLDEWTSGLQRSDLVVIAGRPSMGKTSLAMNIAENAAVGQKLPVAIFSMEMPGNQLTLRLLASLGRINAKRLRNGRLDDPDWPRLTSAVTLLEEAPIFIDDSAALTPMELRTRARRLAREHGLGMIIVDYLQLMQSGDSNENRATEISAITRSLKSLAKELNVPLIALSQLNRSLEQRPNKRPVMSDLRESGAIEQDADVIFFIYRDEVYNEDSAEKGTAEIIIGKQRNGPTGTVRMTFLGEFTRFENYINPAIDSRYGG